MNKALIRHGFILILLALVTGLIIPVATIPRLALSSHTIGLLSGTLLIAVGAVWSLFTLPARQRRLMYGAWLYSSYMNWFGCLVAAILGTGKTTPVASAGAVSSLAAEAIVAILLVSVAIVSFVAVGLALWGLRSVRDDEVY